jgi:hypothetical protein
MYFAHIGFQGRGMVPRVTCRYPLPRSLPDVPRGRAISSLCSMRSRVPRRDARDTGRTASRASRVRPHPASRAAGRPRHRSVHATRVPTAPTAWRMCPPPVWRARCRSGAGASRAWGGRARRCPWRPPAVGGGSAGGTGGAIASPTSCPSRSRPGAPAPWCQGAVGCVHLGGEPPSTSRCIWVFAQLFPTSDSGAKCCGVRAWSCGAHKTLESTMSDVA